MSIKAGRVGVNPSQVNPVDGSILSSATSGYTKQEADAKFLTQTNAASTYESKSDASTAHNALQPKTLAVPIEMLSGTKLSVETALQGLNAEKQNMQLSVPIEMLVGSQLVPKTTVEAVLQTMNEALTNAELTDAVTPKSSEVTTSFTVSENVNSVIKIGKLVQIDLKLSGVTASSGDSLFTIPSGFRPKNNSMVYLSKYSGGLLPITIYTNGIAQVLETLNNTNCQIHVMYFTD